MDPQRDAFCCFFVTHTDDYVIFRKHSDREISFTQLDKAGSHAIPSGGETSLHAGRWALAVDGEPFLELEVLKRIPVLIAQSSVSKRAALAEESQSNKRRQLDEQAARNELSELQPGETMRVDGSYRLKLLNAIRDHADSCAWLGEYSDALGTKYVVVKVIKSNGNNPDEAANLFQCAVDIHSTLNKHPGFLKLLGADTRSSTLHFEYTDAKPLCDQIRPGLSFKGSHAEVLKIMKDMASALSWIHSNGIVHADIKPATILYSPSCGAVFGDFSLSLRPSDVSRPSGTPWYLPPEIMEYWAQRSGACDIWAFGITGLWLRGYIPLPERSWLSWNIEDLHPPGPPLEAGKTATDRMGDWLNYIQQTRLSMHQRDELDYIIYQALEPNDGDRIDAASLCRQLDGLQIDSSATSLIHV